jgi:hypothetical protein
VLLRRRRHRSRLPTPALLVHQHQAEHLVVGTWTHAVVEVISSRI